jgi:hypothetical protein
MTVLDSSPPTPTPDIILIDEETPLLPPVAGDAPLRKPGKSDLERQRQRRKPRPLPKLQISIILLLQLCEPLMSQSIYPYINQVGGALSSFFFFHKRSENLVFLSSLVSWILRVEMNVRLGITLA